MANIILSEFNAEMNGVKVIGRMRKLSQNYASIAIVAYVEGKRTRIARDSATNGYLGRCKMVKLATELLLTLD